MACGCTRATIDFTGLSGLAGCSGGGVVRADHGFVATLVRGDPAVDDSWAIAADHETAAAGANGRAAGSGRGLCSGTDAPPALGLVCSSVPTAPTDGFLAGWRGGSRSRGRRRVHGASWGYG